MAWLLLTIFAILSRSFMSILTKLFSSAAPVSSITQSMLFTGVAAIFACVAIPILGNFQLDFSPTVWSILTVIIVLQAVGNLLYFKGLKELQASVASVAFSSIVIWSTLLSVVFLGANFSLIQYAGVALLLFSIVYIQYKKGGKYLEPAVLYIMAGSLCYAGFVVGSAKIASIVPLSTYLLLCYLGPTLIIGILYSKKIKQDLAHLHLKNHKYIPILLLTSLASVGYFCFSYFAYQFAPSKGTVVVLLTLQVVVSVLLGIIFLKEHDRLGRKLSAGALALIASIMIKA